MLELGKNMKQRDRRRRNKMLKKEEKILNCNEINKMEWDDTKFSEALYSSICLHNSSQYFKTFWAAQPSFNMRRENMTTHPTHGIVFPTIHFYTFISTLKFLNQFL